MQTVWIDSQIRWVKQPLQKFNPTNCVKVKQKQQANRTLSQWEENPLRWYQNQRKAALTHFHHKGTQFRAGRNGKDFEQQHRIGSKSFS